MPVAEVVTPEMAWRMGFAKPPRIWTAFVAYGVFMSLQVVLIIVLVAMQMSGSSGFEIEDFDLTLNQLLFVLGFSVFVSGGTAICAAMLSPEPFARRLGLVKPKLNLLVWIIAPISCYALSLSFSAAIKAMQIQFNLADPFPIDQLVMGQPLWKQILAVCIVSLGAGFAEEFLFRGYMQTRLTKRIGFIGSLVIVSLLFGIAHLNLVQGTFAMLLGFYVGTLAHRSGSIWPAIWCHAFSNFCAIVVTLNLPEMKVPGYLAVIGLGVPTTVCGTLAMLWLTRDRASLTARDARRVRC